MMKFRVLCLISSLILASCFARSQDYPSQASVFHPNQVVQINNLPLRAAQSTSSSATLIAALDIVFHHPDVCCGKGSTLEDVTLSADSLSLKELGNKLQGKRRLRNGRPIMVTAEYLSPSSIGAEQLIAPLTNNQPFLMEWNSHLYVVYGAVFDETVYSSGLRDYVIHKLLLFDPRLSTTPNETTFSRQKDDWTKVQGLLLLKALLQ